MAVLSKFDELRIKTGAQLVRLVNNQLELGICEARQALRSADTRTFAEDHYLRAREAYAEAVRWILLVDEIAQDERSRLETRLDHLRAMLEGLAVLCPPTSDGISAPARALWKARDCPAGSPEDDWFQAERALKSQMACVGN